MNIANIIGHNKIVILGRGPTARFYKKKKNDFLIGINYKFLNNFKFDAIIKDRKIFLKKKIIKLPKKFSYKIGSIEFTLLNFLLYLNNHLNDAKVFLYGFDFKKFSPDDDIFKEKRTKNDYLSIQENIDVNSQLFAFEYYKKIFSNLKIYKFGFDFYSDFNLTKIRNSELEIKNNELEIIAEFTTNHQGSTDRLIKLLNCAVKSGCGTIKFQKRNVATFYPKSLLESKYQTPISKNFFEYRNSLELKDDQIDIIKQYQKKYNLKIIFSALDYPSYKQLRKDGFKYFKIPSTISKHIKFIKYLANINKKLLYISTGMTDQKYLDFILKTFKKKKIVLMHAISAYPTSFENMNLNIVKKYVKLSEDNKNIIPGYSSHDIGSLGSILAVACGAKVIEKHIKIGNTDWMHFDDTAIDAELEFPNYIDKLKKTYLSLGKYKKKIYDFEFHKYPVNKIT